MSRLCSQAQDQLFHARRILGYSYVFAFFMFGQVMFADEVTPSQNAINQNLFEDQQQQLEQAVRSWSSTLHAAADLTVLQLPFACYCASGKAAARLAVCLMSDTTSSTPGLASA